MPPRAAFIGASSKLLTPELIRLMDIRFSNDESLVKRVLVACNMEVSPSRLFLKDHLRIDYDVAPGAPQGLPVVEVDLHNFSKLLTELRSGLEYRFAPGIYQLEHPLVLPHDVRMTGAASGRTVFNALHTQAILAIEQASNVTVELISFAVCAASAIRVQQASNILLSRIFIDSPAEYGVHVDDACDGVSIIGCHIRSTGYGGIMARGLISNLVIADNTVVDSYRRELEISNYGAAIRVQALEHLRTEYDNSITMPGCRPSNDSLLFNGVFSHYVGPRRPRNVAVTGNRVINSRSQGIYLSGALLSYISDNFIVQCDKEAMCIDHQSAMNIITTNTIIHTGQRDNQSLDELANDHIDSSENGGRFVTAKLPAISIDYSDLNVLSRNSVLSNSGGGIKAVRLACFNLIDSNVLTGNNAGDNDVHVFAEVLLGDASVEGTMKKTYRQSFDNRDYGSSANAIIANRLESNRRGIQINKKSIYNFILRNQIFGCQEFDFRILNDLTYSVAANNTPHPLPSGSWPPTLHKIM